MKARYRYPTLVRSLAAAAALAIAAQGGGLPMCVSLLPQSAAPCGMRTHKASSAHDSDNATLSAAPSGHDACHSDAANLGCTTGGACPSGVTAAPVWANVPFAPLAASCGEGLGPASTLISYLAPPLSPPPQA